MRELEKEHFNELWQKYKDLPGWLSKAEAEILFGSALLVEEGQSIAEIGSWKGKSSIFVASALKFRKIESIKLYCLDLFSGSEEHQDNNKKIWTLDAFKKNIKDAEVEEYIVPVVGNSQEKEIYSQIPDSLGMVFIDGDHSYEGVKKDYEIFSRKLTPNGLILFHDTVWWRGVHKLVAEEIFFSNNYCEIEWAGSIIRAKKLSSDESRVLSDKFKGFGLYVVRQMYFVIGYLKSKLIPAKQNDGS